MNNIHILPTEEPSNVFITKTEGLGFDNQMLENIELDCQNQHIYLTSEEEIMEGDWVYNTEFKNIRKPFLTCNDITSIQKEDRKIILTTNQYLIKYGLQAIDDEFLEWFVNNSEVEFVETQSRWLTFDLDYWLSELPSDEREDLIGKSFDEKLLAYYKKNNVKERPIDSKIYRILLPKEKHIAIKGGDEIVSPSSTTITFKSNQETLEEVAERLVKENSDFEAEGKSEYQNGRFNGIIEGVKWHQERSYNEEDMFEFSQWVSHNDWVYLPSKKYWVNEELEELEQKLSSKEVLKAWFDHFKK